jgi:hypothetical protein
MQTREEEIANQLASQSGFMEEEVEETVEVTDVATEDTTDNGNTDDGRGETPEDKGEEVVSEPQKDEVVDTNQYTEEITQLKSKIQEYEERLSSQPEVKEPEYANEFIKKLNDMAKAGVNVESDDFWKWQSIDINAFSTDEQSSAMELVRLELKVKNPGMPDDRIERKLRRNYPALFDDTYEPGDNEFQNSLDDLYDDAYSAKKTLSDHKSKITLPKVDLTEKAKQEEAAKKAIDEFNSSVRQAVTSYKEEPITVGEQNLSYFPSEDAKKFIESSLVNNATLLQDLWVDKESGKVNLRKAQRDLLLISEFPKIAKMLYDQGVSVGREEIATQLENSDPSKSVSGDLNADENFDWKGAAMRKAFESQRFI